MDAGEAVALGPRVAGIVLAAGAGTRFGGPKALARDPSGESWLVRATSALLEGGCDVAVVVLGAGAAEAEIRLGELEPRLAARTVVARADDWASGLAASLRVGLDAVAGLHPVCTAVAIVPVDVPDLGRETVARLLSPSVDRETLRQASFAGRPGHPAVIGCRHWAALAASLSGDSGARPYLVEHGVTAVDCSDLGTGLDVDTVPG